MLMSLRTWELCRPSVFIPWSYCASWVGVQAPAASVSDASSESRPCGIPVTFSSLELMHLSVILIKFSTFIQQMVFHGVILYCKMCSGLCLQDPLIQPTLNHISLSSLESGYFTWTFSLGLMFLCHGFPSWDSLSFWWYRDPPLWRPTPEAVLGVITQDCGNSIFAPHSIFLVKQPSVCGFLVAL